MAYRLHKGKQASAKDSAKKDKVKDDAPIKIDAANQGMFEDRRNYMDRRVVNQRLPRGSRCHRSKKINKRRVLHMLAGDWYLKTSYLELG